MTPANKLLSFGFEMPRVAVTCVVKATQSLSEDDCWQWDRSAKITTALASLPRPRAKSLLLQIVVANV
jgi:hypothetical protein